MVDKQKSKKTKIAVILFLVAIMIITAVTVVLAFGETNEGYRTITVIDMSGTVGVVRDNMEYSAYTGMHLEEGYTVVTSGNSYVRMLLDDDKYVKLEAGSKAVFEELSGGKTAIRIERGSLVSEVTKPLEVDEDFIVNTPNAVLAVRGTLFRVDLSRNEKGELNTDVMTYGGAVSSKRVQPDGEVEDIEVTIREGFKATVNMDEEDTVYLVDDVEIDLSTLVGSSGVGTSNDVTITETNANGEVINTTPITLESILIPIVIEDIPDDDLVDIYFASENGHRMFVETEKISTQIEERNIDVTQKTSVYEVAEKVENPVEIVIPDDNVPLATTTEAKPEEQSVMMQGPPTDGLGGETTVHTHTENKKIVEATCTADGKEVVSCSECGEIISETVIKSEGHKLNETTVAPTCTKDGSRRTQCTVCGEIISTTVIVATGHTEKTTSANPTCTLAGKTVVSCSVCGEKISETINKATGHKEKTITVEPTCTQDGSETTACTVCGEELYYTILEKTGHTERTTTIEPTCTQDGKTTVTCTVCGEVVSEIVIEKLGHTEETTKVEPTCTQDGSETTACTVCGEELYYTILEKTGHTERTTTIEPTCTQ
ncbi:MAG: FecR domain-containing protein, partial [Clostridia bacterium]|nr:FecR domain-containing protein [Clostridia bacterium]